MRGPRLLAPFFPRPSRARSFLSLYRLGPTRQSPPSPFLSSSSRAGYPRSPAISSPWARKPRPPPLPLIAPVDPPFTPCPNPSRSAPRKPQRRRPFPPPHKHPRPHRRTTVPPRPGPPHPPQKLHLAILKLLELNIGALRLGNDGISRGNFRQ
jgi:hypothetical protein